MPGAAVFAIPASASPRCSTPAARSEKLATRDVGDERPTFRAAGAGETAWQLTERG